MTVDRLGDIKLGSQWYRIDWDSYRNRDVSDFAPKAATAGGSVVHSELQLYQPLLQTDWKHGIGFPWYKDEAGFQFTTGNVDTRHDGIAMLFTKAVESDTDNNVKEGFTTFNSKVWAWGTAGLRSTTNGSTWSAEYAVGAVNCALAAGTYLFYCPDGARIRKVNKSGTHSDAGNDTDATDYNWLIIHRGYIWAGKDGTNRIHRDSTVDLSELEGTTGDTDLIKVGPDSGYPTKGAIVYAGNLYVATSDGLWVIGEDDIARRVLDFSNEVSGFNFQSMAIHNGYLLFPIRNKIYQWNGARMSDVTPPRLSDTFPYLTYGNFDNFVSQGRFFYCTARTNQEQFDIDLLCFDGVGWHRLCTLLSAGDTAATAINLVTNGDFEDGDFTGWTRSTAAKFYVGTGDPNTGTYYVAAAPVSTGTETLTSDFGTCVAGTTYRVSAFFNESGPKNWQLPNDTLPKSTYVYTSEITASDSAFISSANTTTNYGTNNYIWVGERNDEVNKLRGLVKFSLSSVPTYASIQSAKLQLYATVDKANNGRTFYVHRLLRNWNTSQVTWTNYSTGNAWGTAGAQANTDRSGSIGQRAFTATEKLSAYKTFDLATSTIQKMVAGSVNNYGFLIRADTETNDAYCFISKSHTSPNKPNLIIKYTIQPAYTAVISWYTSGDVLISSDTFAQYRNRKGWVQQGKSLVAPATAAKFKIVITISPGNCVCIDDVSVTATAVNVSAMGYDAVNDYMWYHNDTAADKTYYIPFQSYSEFPYSSFYLGTEGQQVNEAPIHTLISSRLDMGYRWVKKIMPSLVVEGTNLTPNRYLRIEYSLDDGDRVWLGDVTENGATTLRTEADPESEEQTAVEFYYITLYVTFVTDVATQSPILEGLTVRFLMRPETMWGWNFNLLLKEGIQMPTSVEDRDSYDLITDLEEVRDSKTPVQFIDITNQSYMVFVTAVTRQAVEHDWDSGGENPDVEYVANVNLIQAK